MVERTVQSIDDQTATSLLRQGFFERQSQAGAVKDEQRDEILAGKQDQSIGFEDAVYAMTHAEPLWDKSQQALGGSGEIKQGSGDT